MKTTIKNSSEESRPREKLLRVGAQNLEVAELLAILIGSGTTKKNAIELMREVYESCDNNMLKLAHITYDELVAFNGIGEAKAITILAALELSHRRMEADVSQDCSFTSAPELFQFFRSKMLKEDREVFWVILLNNRLKRIGDKCISKGDVKGTVVEPRMVFNYVVTKQATAFAVAHNHPSGNTKPSEADKLLTQRLSRVARELGVNFIDHLIISEGQNNYYSFKEEGLL